MKEQDQKIEWRDTLEITPYESNAKKHPKKQLKQIAESIREFGFNQPIVVDKKGVIIVGHGRYAAATEILEMPRVPVMTIDVNEEQAKAYRLADNKLNESDWDMELVLPELGSLTTPMVELTGFSPAILEAQEQTAGVVIDECLRCKKVKDEAVGHERRSGHTISISHDEDE